MANQYLGVNQLKLYPRNSPCFDRDSKYKWHYTEKKYFYLLTLNPISLHTLIGHILFSEYIN